MLFTPVRAAAFAAAAAALWIGLGSGQTTQVNRGTPKAALATGGPTDHETYAWKPVAIGGGGFITGLAHDARGETWLARADVHGAYIWDNGADRWRPLVTAATMPAELRVQNGVNTGAYEVAVAPSDPRRLYLAIGGRVYRSDDRGAHWRKGGAGKPFPAMWDANGPFRLGGPYMAVSPRDPDLVLLGTPADGLWRSADGGATWSRAGGVPVASDPKGQGALIWFEPAAPGRAPRIFAAAAGAGLFVSVDGGVGFRPLGAGPSAPRALTRGTFARDGSFYASDGPGKHVYRLHGDRWTELSAAAGVTLRWAPAAIAADPRSDDVLLFDVGGRGWRLSDGGTRWVALGRSIAVGAGDPPWLHVADQSFFSMADVQFDPAAPGELWAGTGVGAYRGVPSGGSIAWTSRTRGIEELVANEAVQPPGSAPLFAAWDFGIHVKSDLDAFSTGYGPRERVLIAAQDIAWTPRDPRFLVTNASDTRTGCCSEDGQAVLAGYSSDGGATWTRFATLPTPPGTKADDPWRMSFGSIAVAADSTDNIVWAPANNRSPFFTKDRGRTWSRVVLPGEVLPFTGSFQNYWLPRRTLAADTVLPGTFYLVHSGEGRNAALTGLWRTRDGGATWARVFTGEIAPASRFAAKLRAVPGKAGELFFTSSVADGADTRLRRSRDGGRSWTALADVDHVDDVAFGKAAASAAYPTIFVSGRVLGGYGIWRSTDDAASWSRIAEFPANRLDQVVSLAADPDVFGRVYIGYMGSGWLYGEPARCRLGDAGAGDRSCDAVLAR